MIYLEIAWGRCYAKCQFSVMKNGFKWCENVLHGGDVTHNVKFQRYIFTKENGFRWCENVLHGGDVTQNHEKSIQRLSLNGKVLSLFRSKLICFLHKVFLRKFSRRIENYV